MKSILLLLSTTLLLTACQGLRAPLTPVRSTPGANGLRQLNQSESHQLVNIRWRSPEELQTLATSGLDVFTPNYEQQILQARVSNSELAELRQQGVQVEELPFQALAQERQAFPQGYMTYNQLSQQLQALAQQYPQLIKLEDVGDTWEKQQGRANHDIWGVELTAPNGGNKPAYLLTGGVHARELAPVEILMKLLQHLASQYGKDPRITQLLDTRKVVILPMVNVDGRVKVEQGAAWQRKNTHNSGVDLNRNFDNHWNYQGLKVPSSWLRGVTDPGSEIYSGTGPASEPETQVVQAMFHRYKPALAIDMHAYGDMMLWPLGYSYDDNPHTATFRQLYERTVKNLGFKGGTSAQILYPTTATTRDYAYEQHGAISMTLEIGRDFRPGYSEVESMWTRLLPHLLTMLETPGISR